MTDPPFRWNLARRQELGSLVKGAPAESYPGFHEDLRACCVRLVALAGDSELIFVGRSPESIFDYLSGLLADTSWAERSTLLNLSMRYETSEAIGREDPVALRGIREQLVALHLSPAAIAAGRPHAFIDLVAGGSTFGNLAGLLLHWAADEGVDAAALRRRIRFVGITERSKNSPNTWRWYQRVPWAAEFPRRSLCSVSIPWRLWNYLGNEQKKVSRWHPPMVWGKEGCFTEPPRESYHLEALRLAHRLHEQGRRPEERGRFAAELAAQREMVEPWLRRLVLELRR